MSDFRAELRTAHGPPLVIDADAIAASAATPGGAPPWLLRWLKPELRVVTPFGSWTRAPYGSPGASSWPLVPVAAGVVLLAVLALAVYGALSLLRR